MTRNSKKLTRPTRFWGIQKNASNMTASERLSRAGDSRAAKIPLRGLKASAAFRIFWKNFLVAARGERIKLEIPAGIQQGEALVHHGKNNDIIFVIKIKTPDHLSKKARELLEKLREI